MQAQHLAKRNPMGSLGQGQPSKNMLELLEHSNLLEHPNKQKVFEEHRSLCETYKNRAQKRHIDFLQWLEIANRRQLLDKSQNPSIGIQKKMEPFELAMECLRTQDVKALQKTVENNAAICEALHEMYQKIEDALTPNCINRVGDLLPEKQRRANILMAAAKAAKKAGKKFDPSPYLPGYEIYNKAKHGDPLAHLKKHFGVFLASCNEERVDYLWRGDIDYVDRLLRGALYRNSRQKFERLVQKAGKKSLRQVTEMTDRGRNKYININTLGNSSRR